MSALVDRLRRRLLRQLVRIGQQCAQAAQWQEAVDWYDEAIGVDPSAEDVYRRLMSAYRGLGRPIEVADTYRRCRAALATHLGTSPSAATRALLDAAPPG